MNKSDLQHWFWQVKQHSVKPAAAVAWGNVAEALLGHLLSIDSAFYRQLQITVSDNVVVVFGEAEILPWVDGVNYAHASEEFPTLWLPTHTEPSISIELIFLALRRHYGQIPLLLWPNPMAVIPLDRQFPVNRTLLDTVPRNRKL